MIRSSTWLAGVACVAAGCSNSHTTECGAGTVQQGMVCVGTGLQCGTGTHAEGGACLPDNTRFEILAPSMIRADGWTSSQVQVFGTDPDGSASNAGVLLSVDRSSAGALASPSFVLDDVGGASDFVPCNSVDADCLGPVTFSVARATQSQTVVAQVTVDMVAPPSIGSAAPCLAGGNVLYFHGQNFDYNGDATYSDGTGASFDVTGAPTWATVHVVETGQPSWSIQFGTIQLGIDLIPSTYQNAALSVVAQPGQPGFTLTGNGPVLTNCGSLSTDFQIIDYAADPIMAEVVDHITATFTQHCTEDPTKTITGCVHYSQ